MFRIVSSLALLGLLACGSSTRSQRLPTYGPAPGVQAPASTVVEVPTELVDVDEPAPIAEPSAPLELDEPVLTYTLRRGETLDHFARWAELPVETIADASALTLDARLPVGSQIVVPADHDRRSRIENARDAHHLRRVEGYLASRGGAVGTDFYVVRTGDSAWTIAKLNGDLPVWLLESFNPSIDVENLRPGQALMLPLLADTIDAELAMDEGAGSGLSVHRQ